MVKRPPPRCWVVPVELAARPRPVPNKRQLRLSRKQTDHLNGGSAHQLGRRSELRERWGLVASIGEYREPLKSGATSGRAESPLFAGFLVAN
jgi:hypothetical protein